MAYAIIRTAKLKTNGSIGGSLDHNYRERKTDNADPKLTKYNEHDLESKDAAYQAIQDRLPEKVRKDGVRVIEYMISASPEFFACENNDLLTQEKYFESAKEWLEDKHGKENVITTSIHRDETSPHLIAYVVPYVYNEKKKKETLNCKHFLGGRNKLSAMQTDFHKHVEHFGLNRGIERSDAKHQTIKQFYTKIQNPTLELKESAPTVHVPEPKLLETRAKYGDRVAETIGNDTWNQACDNLENIILKSTTRDYKKIEKENKVLRSQIKHQQMEIKRQNEKIEKLEKSNVVSLKIMALPNSKELINNINIQIKEHGEANIISPVKVGENRISYKWNKENNCYNLKINDKEINQKVTDSFIYRIKSNDKFLSQYSKEEIKSGNLPVTKLGYIPAKPFVVNESGRKLDIQSQSKSQKQQSQDGGMSM